MGAGIGDPAAAHGDDKAEHAAEQRPEQAAGALGREIEGQAEAEEAIGRADDAQIGRAGREHPRVLAEKGEPGMGGDGGGEADDFAQHEGDAAAGQRDAERPRALPGADIGADEGDHGCAETEDDGDQEVFEA